MQAEAPTMAEQPLTVGMFFQLLGYISGALVFIVLIGLDIRTAFRKGAQWVPGHALMLSALTLLVMNFVENQSALLNQNLANSGQLNGEIIKNNLFMIHTARVMLCVLVAFFLPGMARPGYEEKWTKIAALGLSIFVDIFSELSEVHARFGKSGLYLVTYLFCSAKQLNEVSFIVSGAIISVTLIWLILLLISAAIASKSIRNITTQKIPIILGEPAENTWKGVEDQVLKAWIVARACYPESIIAKSALASSATLGVTICIISSIVGWIVQGPFIKVLPGAVSGLKCTMIVLELSFILIGWVVICWRSLSSVAYYGRGRKDEPNVEEPNVEQEPKNEEEEAKKKENWRDSLGIEDFWTRHIVELREAEESKLGKLKVDERVSKMFVMKLKKLNVDERVSKMIAKEESSTSLLSGLLDCVFWMQRFVVFTSKVYWFLSQLTFGNRYIRKIVSTILSSHFKEVRKDYVEYKPILKAMENVLWEQTAWDVFLTNRKSIKQAKTIMTKGNGDGEKCHALIPFLRKRRSKSRCNAAMLYLDPGTAYKNAGLKFLWKHHPEVPTLEVHPEVPTLEVHPEVPKVPTLEVADKYFKYDRKQSWKLPIVSLINVIILLSPADDTINCLQAYYEAWELIDLVDGSDPETDSLLSKAADRLFTKLREPGPERAAITTMKEADAAISKLAEKSKRTAELICDRIDEGKETMEDWEKLIARNALYKLCKGIDCSSGDLRELLDELQSTLLDIICGCIERVAAALLGSSRHWAQDLDKNKLLEAVYIAGKSRGLMELLKWEPNCSWSS